MVRFNSGKLILVIGWMLLAIGCESKTGPDYQSLGLVDISGQVLLQGKPLPNVEIRLEAPDTTYSYGVTDANGRYTMMFDSRKAGVIPGEKRVVILPKSASGTDVSGVSSEEEDDPDQKKLSVSTIPKAYGAKSKIRVTISESDSNVDFDLSPDGKTTGRRSK